MSVTRGASSRENWLKMYEAMPTMPPSTPTISRARRAGITRTTAMVSSAPRPMGNSGNSSSVTIATTKYAAPNCRPCPKPSRNGPSRKNNSR